MSKPWPFDPRLAHSDIFNMIELMEKNPKGLAPESLEALRNDPYARHTAAQIEATDKPKPKRRGR